MLRKGGKGETRRKESGLRPHKLPGILAPGEEEARLPKIGLNKGGEKQR